MTALCLACIPAGVPQTAKAEALSDGRPAVVTLIGRVKEALDTDLDSLPAFIREVETQAKTCADTASAAVLHSMAAEMYHSYYRQNRHAVDRRTLLDGFIPDDMREWTANLFTQKIKEELEASLQPAELLRNTPASLFYEAMEKGKDSPVLRPTLYDFLAHRALEIQPSETVYRDLLAFRRSQPDRKAALPVELDYLNYIHDPDSEEGLTAYEYALDSLLEAYAGHDYSVEIVCAKLDLLEEKRYRSDTPDSIRGIEYRLCKDVLARFPAYERIAPVRNRLASLEEKLIRVAGNRTVYPGKNIDIELQYANIRDVTVRIYRSRRKIEETLYFNRLAEDTSKLGALVKELSFPLELRNPYTVHDTMLSIPTENPGLYEYTVTSSGTPLRAANGFSVSRLATVWRVAPSGVEVWVADYLSGKPVNGATVDYYRGDRHNLRKTGTVKTDAFGLAAIPEKDLYACRVRMEGDEMSPLCICPFYARSGVKSETKVSLFTDRGLYRPGQTLFFKGIVYVRDTEHPHVVPDTPVEVILRDVNYKEVATQVFTTNSFGSFHGSFTLPVQTLTGRFTLSAGNRSVDIQVEEYKRPTFRIELPPVKEEVSFGDEVNLRGKVQTFSGVALTNGAVVYRILRRPFFYYGGPMQEEQVAEGVATTDRDGNFSFPFRPEKDGASASLSFRSYEIIIQVTDSKGETQEARTAFSVGDRSFFLSSNLYDRADKDTAIIRIAAHTLNGEAVRVRGNYSFSVLEDTETEGEYVEGRTLLEGTFTSGEPLDRGLLSRLPSGRIRLRLSAADSKGRTVNEQQDIIVYSLNDKRPPVFSHTWLLPHPAEYAPGEEASICFGTSDKEVYLLYELFANGQHVARRQVKLSNENLRFRIPFLHSYGDGAVASFTFIKEGKLHTQHTTLLCKRPSRALTVKPETFRDKLLPGSRESWKFRVSDADSLPVTAEVLAGMYDASLDRLRPFAWYFFPVASPYLHYARFTEGEGLLKVYDSDVAFGDRVEMPPFAFDRLNWQGALDFPARGSLYMTRNKILMSSAPVAQELGEYAIEEEEIAMYADNSRDCGTVETVQDAGVVPPPEIPSPALFPLRADFSETAFFFPSLQTDSEGNVAVHFTLPESNTTWKFRMLAHTADWKYGMLTREVITQKPLMTLPNLPRFIRRGDEVRISAQIMNLSEEETEGNVRLELFDPATDKLILPAMIQAFALPSGGAATLSWPVTLPDAAGLAGCRIIADSDIGSDGEQHLIPVLPDEILLTESTPFFLADGGEKQVTIAGAQDSATRRPHRMTLEFSNNPVWYAVQALPAIAEPGNDDALSWFAAYYSQTLAASIARSNPRIRKVIDQWEAQKETGGTLLSSLERNEELKHILPEETPWVLDAGTETGQKQRLPELFDPNRLPHRQETAMRELLRQQHEEGGWGWFKGFYPNRNITARILEGMTQLTRLKAVQYGTQEKAMQMKALAYLDKAIREDYDRLRKSDASLRDGLPTPLQLQSLYVRSAYGDIPETDATRNAVRYYTEQARKHWRKASLYEKGEIALLMHRNGDKKVAEDILNYLRKTATTSEEDGMYWANNRRGQNFSLAPTDVHCLLMTVFRTLGAENGETDHLKQWLLNRKRTQNWESTPATVNALYCLLDSGNDWLAETDGTAILWGDKTLHTSSGEAGTGYLRESVSGKDLTPALHTLTLRREGKSPAWGAVFYQYFEPVGNVSKQGGALSVEKKIFVETLHGTQRHIVPVGADRPLKIGDKVIVRLTIRADREMEYVSLKDMRAGCFEPAVSHSGMMTFDRLVCYHSPKDASENFFFDLLPAGTYVLEYAAYISRSGRYSGGIATLQCQYAPEFISHTEGNPVFVQK
jgi:hypothetical protein